MRRPYALSPSEIEILQLGASDPDIISDYFFRPHGADQGFKFDYNFDPEGAWQKAVHHAKQTDCIVIGGYGCIGGETRIFNPITGESVPVKDLYRAKTKTPVLSLSETGAVVSYANPPFIKGQADLFRVKLENGQEFVAQKDHRVLTPSGWKRVASLFSRPSEYLAVFDPSHPLSNLEFDQLARPEDVLHLTKKVPGCRDDYSQDRRQCGVQLRLAKEVDQFPFPLQGDALEYSRVYCTLGDRACGSKCNQFYQPSSHLSIDGSFLRAERLGVGDQCCVSPLAASQPPCRRSAYQPFPLSSFPHLPIALFGQGEGADEIVSFVSCSNSNFLHECHDGSRRNLSRSAIHPGLLRPSFEYRASLEDQEAFCESIGSYSSFPPGNYLFPNCNSNRWIRIESIEFARNDIYYDLEVPEYGNYLAEGVWHHNTGKTVGVGISAAIHCATTPDFKFLNAAPTSWQAKQMYEAVLNNAYNTPFEPLIWEKPRRPYPKIVIKFRIADVEYTSTMEFMSADKNAVGILSWEGDWINIDEAGLLDNLEDIVGTLGSRLRGSIRGRPRLGRLSMITNSWDNPFLWQYFDQAVEDPENFLSIVVSTRHNHNVTPAQLEKMILRIPEDERERFLDGARPEGKGNFFAKEKIYQCENKLYGEIIQERVDKKWPGYSLEKIHGAGVVHFQVPREKNELYILMGDPGAGEAPRRNAPVLMTWGVPVDFPKVPARLVNFWWGSGHGQITPFVNQLLELRSFYAPMIAGVDATGTQKNMAELINIQYLGFDDPFDVKGIVPMDFSGSKKSWYLHSLRMFIEAGKFAWPKMVIGIRSQLANYDLIRDGKIAQDIVATMAMSAYAIRNYFYVDLADILPETISRENYGIVEADLRQKRSASVSRERRSYSRR